MSVCVCAGRDCAWECKCLLIPEDEAGSPEAGVMSDYECPDMVAGN